MSGKPLPPTPASGTGDLPPLAFRIPDPAAAPPLAGQNHPVGQAANQDRRFDLAFSIYRSLLTCADTRDRLADGEEPGDLHHELAKRAILAARIFWAEARRDLGTPGR